MKHNMEINEEVLEKLMPDAWEREQFRKACQKGGSLYNAVVYSIVSLPCDLSDEGDLKAKVEVWRSSKKTIRAFEATRPSVKQLEETSAVEFAKQRTGFDTVGLFDSIKHGDAEAVADMLSSGLTLEGKDLRNALVAAATIDLCKNNPKLEWDRALLAEMPAYPLFPEGMVENSPVLNSKPGRLLFSVPDAVDEVVHKYEQEKQKVEKLALGARAQILPMLLAMKPSEQYLCGALMLAAEKGYADSVEMLIKNGAHVNIIHADRRDGRRTPLHKAVLGGDADTVKVLCDYGASLDAKDISGTTAVDLAHVFRDDALEELSKMEANRSGCLLNKMTYINDVKQFEKMIGVFDAARGQKS